MSEQTTSEMASSAPQMPEAVRATFEQHPQAHMVLLEMGHGYAKAKYPGRCPVSGLFIIAGQTVVRRLHVWCRNGRSFDGYAHADACAELNFYGRGENHAAGIQGTSCWRRWTETWLEEADLENAPVGTRLAITEAGDYGFTTKTWYKNGANEWTSDKRGKQTVKQFLAAMKRRTKGFTWMTEPPVAPRAPIGT